MTLLITDPHNQAKYLTEMLAIRGYRTVVTLTEDPDIEDNSIKIPELDIHINFGPYGYSVEKALPNGSIQFLGNASYMNEEQLMAFMQKEIPQNTAKP